MKKLFLIGVVAALAACSSQQPETGYTINVTANGDLAQLPNDTLVLLGGTLKSTVQDTVVLVDGKCVIKGETQTPNYYTLLFKGEKRGFTRFFLENDKYDVVFDVADPASATVVGGEVQTMLNEMNAKYEELSKLHKLDSLNNAYRTATPDERENIRKVFEEVNEEVDQIESAYLEANPVSPYALSSLAREIYELPYEELVESLAAYDTIPMYAENVLLKESKDIADYLKNLQPGNQAPDFVQNDTDGKPVKFSDVYSKNKLTMIDFWASWCGPCRAFNPQLVDIYKKFHRKGFEILGVSNDTNKEAWLKGIKDDKLKWPQVSDLKGWNNEVGALYCVRSIPQNIFVDQSGKIVGRRIERDKVEQFIEDYLTK